MHPSQIDMYKRILIVLDDHPSSESAIRHGVELARTHRADVVFLYVLPNYAFMLAEVPTLAALSTAQFNREAHDTAERVLKEAMKRAEAIEVASYSTMGSGIDAAIYVTDVASRRHCDLIVVATHGQNSVMRLLTGSVVPGLITKAAVPVLVCRTAK